MATERPGTATRRTRFSDVCGTIDEFKRLLHEEPAASAAHPEVLDSLIDDALFMEARMALRLREYQDFRAQIFTIAAQLQALDAPLLEDTVTLTPRLMVQLGSGQPLSSGERSEAIARAEAIRLVAQNLEDTLGRYKTLVLDVGRAYRAVQGNRHWVLDEDEAREAALPGEADWVRWLPPSPHRERIVRFLRAGRAELQPPEDAAAGNPADRPPLVQFEDGGVMPLPSVRWDDEVRNFYPVDAPPHPHGRHFRGSGHLG